MGPETKKRAPGERNFKNYFWRPVAAVSLLASACSGEVYNEDRGLDKSETQSPKVVASLDVPSPFRFNDFPDEFSIQELTSPTQVALEAIPEASIQPNPETNPSPIPSSDNDTINNINQKILSQQDLQSNKKEEQELSLVIKKMIESGDLFNSREIEDVKLYYPIYKAVADKYKIKWYLLWIVHEAESTASTDPNAFNGESGHIGGFQRALSWPEDWVDQAAEGLGSLSSFPQRNSSDWKEAAFAARYLTTIKKDNSVLGELLSYSAAGPAYERWRLYQLYEKVFD